MVEYQRDINQTTEIIQDKGIIVVMGKPQVRNKDDGAPRIKPEYVVAAVNGIWQAGLPAELTFRIPESILKEAVQQLVIDRQRLYEQGKKVVLGIGSVCAFSELESAIGMGVDFVVAPSNGIGGTYCEFADGSLRDEYYDPIEFVAESTRANVFAAPAAFTPSEIGFYLFRNDGVRPDALKIFNSELLAADNAKAFAGLLAPFARDEGEYKNVGYIIIPTGAVNRKTGPAFVDAIKQNGFYPVLGMSDPLDAMKEKASKNPADYAASVQKFLQDYAANKKAFEEAKAAKR